MTVPGLHGKQAAGGAARALALAMVAGACKKGPAVTAVPPDATSTAGSSVLEVEIAKAEDLRRAKDLPLDVQKSRDPAVRRGAARAVARILDDDDGALFRALEDEDGETVAWGAYGLGESCVGRQESHVRALAVRLASLRPGSSSTKPNPGAAILRALGRCGSDAAEKTLGAWLGRGGAHGSLRDLDEDEAAAFALGDIADQRGSLAVDSTVALIEAAERVPPLTAALYALGRSDVPSRGDLEPRVTAAARAALGRPGQSRIFALRPIGRSAQGARSLAQVLSSNDFTPAERAEAARELGRLGEAGEAALAAAIPSMLEATPTPVQGDRFGVVMAAVGALGQDPPSSANAALGALARIEEPLPRGAPTARRASALRCAAAEKLARGAWDSDLLVACDIGDGQAGQRARLAALDRGPLVKARRAAWLDLFHRTDQPRAREAAIEAIRSHPELDDAGRRVIAEALRSGRPGMVAAAAKVISARPQRFSDPRVESALAAAIEHVWTEDQVETRAALVEAALAAGGGESGRAFAEAACADANQTVRARAARALAATGAGSRCAAPDSGGPPAPEIGHALARPTRVVFDTDAGVLGVRFDPGLAPVAATRFVALARSGFYTGIAVHRVVPGFVVQLGDREGDGYGGSGRLLRCETSPVPFAPLDVGVALTGRDTGSSQIFVALARRPTLDGQYTWVGRADGDWNAVAEGDIVHAVRVEE